MNRILLVDDFPENISSYKFALEEIDEIAIVIASNEDEAIEIIDSSPPFSLIITDLIMNTKHSGLDVLKAAKSKDLLTFVILITGSINELDREEAYKLGAFECIEKAAIGKNAATELHIKARNALHYIDLIKDSISKSRTLEFYRSYFDPFLTQAIIENHELLNSKSETITICFWDIQGFSALCEALKEYPDLILNFLEDFFNLTSEVIFSHQGILDKYLGDGVMALFGVHNFQNLPDYEVLSAGRAINAALDICTKFQELEEKHYLIWNRKIPNQILINIKCGIHTGKVIVGNMGSALRKHYTAIGPSVNLASRIESTAKGGEIRVSTTTRNLALDNFIFEECDSLENVKNIPGKFKIYKVVSKVS